MEYGSNEHPVNIPSFFSFIIDVMTGPFFVLQYLFAIENILTKYYGLGVSLLAVAFITVGINYILLYMSYRKIQQMAEK